MVLNVSNYTMKKLIIAFLLAFSVVGVYGLDVTSKPYGMTAEGEDVIEYTLAADNMSVVAISYGGIVTAINVKDKNGVYDNVVLNLADLKAYEADRAFFGPIIGRFGNRLAGGKFSIDGKEYVVKANENGNALHGGARGFDTFVWKSEKVRGDGFVGVKFSRTSPDGEMGFPGNLDVEVVYKLCNDNEFSIEYRAMTDKPTVCNLTWHPFFNLAGAGNGSILTHHFQVPADYITVVDKELIPTGENMAIKGTPFDFNGQGIAIGERLNKSKEQLFEMFLMGQGSKKPKAEKGQDTEYSKSLEQLKVSGGAYDHNFILSKPVDVMGKACSVYHPKSGRSLTVLTEEPCLQFYSGQGFDGTKRGSNGKAYYPFAGFVIEPQHAPDAPNHPSFFPGTLLMPGEVFTSKSVYRFSTDSVAAKPRKGK